MYYPYCNNLSRLQINSSPPSLPQGNVKIRAEIRSRLLKTNKIQKHFVVQWSAAPLGYDQQATSAALGQSTVPCSLQRKAILTLSG